MTINVGFIGPGIMGGPMALNLMKGGHKLWVHARRPEATKTLVAAGATACASAAEVGKNADVIFLIVSDTPDVESVIFGETGIAKGARSGSVVVDMSTVSVEGSREMAEAAKAAGVAYLRAPVSGNPSVVEAGNLTIVVSGDEEAFRLLEPALRDIGPHVFYLGGGEEARVMKLALNLVIACIRGLPRCVGELRRDLQPDQRRPDPGRRAATGTRPGDAASTLDNTHRG